MAEKPILALIAVTCIGILSLQSSLTQQSVPAGSATLLQLGKARTEAGAATCADHEQVAAILREVPLECLEIAGTQGVNDNVRYCLQRHKTKLALVEDNTEAMRLYNALQRDAACSRQKQKASP